MKNPHNIVLDNNAIMLERDSIITEIILSKLWPVFNEQSSEAFAAGSQQKP
jgi:hypothetical protein